MTIGYKSDKHNVLIELPIENERNFLILNYFVINEKGQRFFIRKLFDVYKYKKLRIIFTQYFILKGELFEDKGEFLLVQQLINSKKAKYFDEIQNQHLNKFEKESL